jgi:hypothetical protein
MEPPAFTFLGVGRKAKGWGPVRDFPGATVLKQDLLVGLFMASVSQLIHASWVVNWNECGSQEKPQ